MRGIAKAANEKLDSHEGERIYRIIPLYSHTQMLAYLIMYKRIITITSPKLSG